VSSIDTDVKKRAATSAPVAMDPRIRERRVAVRRDVGRRRLRIVVALSSTLVVASGAYAVTRSALLDVDTIRVRGTTNSTPQAIASAAGLDRHPQMLDADPARLATRIESVPWVQQATVARRWPGTVEVTVVERTPLAAMPSAFGGWAVVDATGRVLDAAPAAPAGMPTLSAPDGAPAPGGRVPATARAGLTILESLPASLSARVTGVRVDGGGDLVVAIDKAPLVQFGPATAIRAKLVAVATLLARTNLRGVTGIDVRVPTAPVLTRG